MSLLKKTFSSLFKTRDKIRKTFNKILNISHLTDKDFVEIEEALLSADISWNIVERIISDIKSKTNHKLDWEEILTDIFTKVISSQNAIELKRIILMVGVNGVGKTTACAKLANFLKNKNNKITLVAADTYRAAAISQLRLWSEKLKVDFISNDKSLDPAAIAYDGVNSGLYKESDYIIIDTAGRIQNSQNLMNELQKIYRVILKLSDQVSVCMNIDANIGQNSISQISEFNEYIPLDTVILNKMDGTAKGGIAISLMDKFSFPISFIGLGEKINDLEVFDMNIYIKSLISKNENSN